MNNGIEYQGAIFSIQEDILNMSKVLENERKTIITKGAKVIKSAVINNLHRSDLGPTATNYDGTPYIHMKDDVKTQIKDDKTGNTYAIIKGGRYTGYKWHMLNNGTSKTKATHFVDKTLEQTENEINQIIDEAITKAVQ
jgi:HK97 gp10 family phage protein